MLSSFLDALFQHALARSQPQEAAKAEEFVSEIMNELFDRIKASALAQSDIKLAVNQVAIRINTMCLENSWARSSAGCVGFKMLLTHELGRDHVIDRVVDVTRTLLHAMKGIPYELPTEIAKVKEVMSTALRLSVAATKAENSSNLSRINVGNLAGIYFTELQGQNATVRKVAQESIELISQLLGVPITELLMPQRDRMLTSIYTKPLRALPFAVQIGMIDSVRYCLSLDPPLPELNEELLRLLHEALALADAEDSSLMNRMNQRQSALEIVKLRVACIKLLTAAMPLTDCFSKQNTTRQRSVSLSTLLLCEK